MHTQTSTAALDPARLSNIRQHGGKTTAACPACREAGADKTGDHLTVLPDGRFSCVVHTGIEGADHRKRIFALAGVASKSNTPAATPVNDAALKPVAPAGPARETAAAVFASLSAKYGRLVAQWPYRDAAGKVVFEVGRFEPEAGEKTFRPARRDPDGWRTVLPAGPLPLYRLPELLAAAPGARVYVCEGEKCADAVSSLGLLATCSQGGACGDAKTDWHPLAGRCVTILPDNDEPGRKYAANVSARLLALTPPAQVKVADLPGLADLGEGADVFDWLEMRESQEPAVLVETIENAPAVSEPLPGALVSAADWLTTEPPQPDYVLSGVFEIGDRVLLVAPSKCRKSFFALQLAASVAAGVPFLGVNVPTPRRVLFVTLENRAEWEQRRLRGICHAGRITPDNLGLPCRLAFMCCRGLPVSVAEIGTAAAAFHADLVIIDPTYALSDSGDEMDQTARRNMLHAVARIAAAGPAVILVAHDPKGQAGDRDTRDRGSGSNLVNRAVDATFALTPYGGDARDPEADSLAVLSVLARNAPPRPDVCIRFFDGAFNLDLDRAPVKATSSNRKRSGQQSARDLDVVKERAVALVTKPMPPGELKHALRVKLGLPKGEADTLASMLTAEGGPLVRWTCGTFPQTWLVGTGDMYREWQRRSLPSLSSQPSQQETKEA